ncbi:hypothetical protein Salat_2540200 [Sesamum alatum]|uniref:Uncharacterized protein n=1 Tax=Sesamum alatum TaxID=300844 RepID=A0AAE1XT56_9LAMI|nr:hypothetical protein Salat_2540200 [Sesamum alatum]
MENVALSAEEEEPTPVFNRFQSLEEPTEEEDTLYTSFNANEEMNRVSNAIQILQQKGIQGLSNAAAIFSSNNLETFATSHTSAETNIQIAIFTDSTEVGKNKRNKSTDRATRSNKAGKTGGKAKKGKSYYSP